LLKNVRLYKGQELEIIGDNLSISLLPEVKLMSLQKCWNDEIPADTVELGEVLLKPDDPYRLVGQEASRFFRFEDFVSLYKSIGRGAICPIVLSLVTVFQFLENLPDREAAKQARLRIDWKYALHQPLTWLGFHYSDLCNFRKRLLEHEKERLVFDKVLQWVKSHGFVRKYGKQRTDSSHVLGAVERMSRLELTWETLRVTLRELKQAVPTWYERTIPAAFHEAYHERQSDWKLSEDEVRQALQRAGQDGYWLLDHIDTTAPEAAQRLAGVETLRIVLDQQFERTEAGVEAKKVPIKGKDIIVTPHDTGARWAEKRGKDWIGYKIQVTETVDEEQAVQFITDVDTVAANDGDSEQVDPIQSRLAERDLLPREHLVDQGYTSGPNLAKSAERGVELVGPVAVDQSNKPEGYRQADFDLDFEAHQATCPGERESASWTEYKAPEAPDDPHRREIKIRFGSACDGCPAGSLCAPGKTGRTLTVSAFYAELSARRAEQQTDEFKERLKERSAVEGTISEFTRCHGARRARYRWKSNVRLQHLFTGAAVNIKRLARALALQDEENGYRCGSSLADASLAA
jgi:transposase